MSPGASLRNPGRLAYDLIESLACGTPVIAGSTGAVPAMLEQGVTGMLCRSFEEMLAAADVIPLPSGSDCRQVFESRFTVARMARETVEMYHQLLDRPLSTDPLHASDSNRFACQKPRSSPIALLAARAGPQSSACPLDPIIEDDACYRLLLGWPPSNPGACPEGNPLVPLMPPPPTRSSPIEPVASCPFWPGTPELPEVEGADRTWLI